MQLDQILNSGKDPENSIATIEQFEKEIRDLGLQPDVEKNFLKKCNAFKKQMLQKTQMDDPSSSAAAASAVGAVSSAAELTSDPEGCPE